jgi:outer membrane protein TolC
MLVRLGMLSLLICWMVGCAHSSVKDCEDREMVRDLCAAPIPCPRQVPVMVPPEEPPLEGEHPLAFYVQAALMRNPEVLAAERHAAAKAEVVPQVTALPDPVVAATIWPSSNQALQTAAGRITNTMAVSQAFPWCGKLRLRGEAATLDAKIALTQLAESQLKVMEEVKLAFYNTYLAKRSLSILDDSEKLLYERFIEPARSRKGRTARLDVQRAEVELGKLNAQRIELRQQLKQAQADLAKTLSTFPESNLDVPDELDFPAVPEQLEQLYHAALISRPELQGRLNAVSRDERLVELARLSYFPDVSVGFVWYDLTTNHALSRTANGENGLGISVGVNLPIWYSKLRAGVREAEDHAAESARLYQASRDEVFRRIQRLTVEARAREQELELYRQQLLPVASEALDTASEGYKTDTVNPVRVIDNWLQLMSLRLRTAQLQASLGQTLAKLERVVGEQLTPMQGAAGQTGSGSTLGQIAPTLRCDEHLPLPQRLKEAPPGKND